jgi:protease-4
MTRRLAIWLFLVVLLVALVVIAAAGSSGASSISTPLKRNGVSYTGTVMQDGSSGTRVAMVPIFNALVDGDSPANGSATGGDDVVRMLEAITEDSDAWDGVILELDTPGGSVMASEEIVDAIERLKEKKIPILAWMRGTAASAGYYVSAPTDRIVASSNTFTGSIGVILEYYVVDELADKVGVGSVTIKSGKLKDIGNPFRQPTTEERDLFQTIIDQSYGQFVGVVAEGRDMSESTVRELADGRIYTGEQAKENGLVDVLGLRRTAYDELAKLIDEKDVKGEDLDVVRFTRTYGLLAALSAEASPALASIAAAGDVAGAVRGDRGAIGRLAETQRLGGGVASLQYRMELG